MTTTNIDNFVLIIGAVKCGTTSLYNYLVQHPQIAACRTKESHFFSDPKLFSNGFDYYQNLWDWNPDIHKFALEATPNYTRITNFNLLKAVENIYKIQKTNKVNFKFIYLMRNPLDRIESHYNHIEACQQEPNKKPFCQGLDEEIIDVSKYAMQIEEYYNKFDRDSILLLNFDDLKSQPLNVVKKVCQFLDIDSNYEFKDLNTIHNNSSERVQIIFPGYTWVRKTKSIKSLVRLFPSEFKKVFKNLLGRKINNQIYLSSEQKKYILNELKDDLNKLKNDYGLEIDRWNIKV
jgi:hypothetical protein